MEPTRHFDWLDGTGKRPKLSFCSWIQPKQTQQLIHRDGLQLKGQLKGGLNQNPEDVEVTHCVKFETWRHLQLWWMSLGQVGPSTCTNCAPWIKTHISLHSMGLKRSLRCWAQWIQIGVVVHRIQALWLMNSSPCCGFFLVGARCLSAGHHLRLIRGPAGNRTTTGSLSASNSSPCCGDASEPLYIHGKSTFQHRRRREGALKTEVQADFGFQPLVGKWLRMKQMELSKFWFWLSCQRTALAVSLWARRQDPWRIKLEAGGGWRKLAGRRKKEGKRWVVEGLSSSCRGIVRPNKDATMMYDIWYITMI